VFFLSKKRKDKIKKELVDSISDLSFHDYQKIIEKKKNSKNLNQLAQVISSILGV
jgi:F0F1-type ATP synthase membrane subunit b/b'